MPEGCASIAGAQGENVELGVLRPRADETGAERLTVEIRRASLTGDVLEQSFGLLVGAVQAGSPAEAAGVLPGDLIVGRAMGAYTWASASEFNFFPKATVVSVNRRAGDTGTMVPMPF